MIKDFFSSKNITLALGSGSAKGVAHIGVIEALLDYGFKINAVAGTSIGGIVAAYYSLGKLDVLKEWLLSFTKTNTIKALDFTLSGGFISGKKLMKHFEGHIGDATFEDCNIPLYIVATNFTTGEKEVFSSGNILHAIRASISVPAVFKPYHYNNSYYVDGAVTDPVPSSVLFQKGYKNIVAVHLNKHISFREDEDRPSITEIMGRSMSIIAKELAESLFGNEIAIISPDLSGYSMFEVYKSKEIMDIGYNTAEKVIKSGKIQHSTIKKIKNYFSYCKKS